MRNTDILCVEGGVKTCLLLHAVVLKSAERIFAEIENDELLEDMIKVYLQKLDEEYGKDDNNEL